VFVRGSPELFISFCRIFFESFDMCYSYAMYKRSSSIAHSRGSGVKEHLLFLKTESFCFCLKDATDKK
jgi:hypothetical protein